MTVDMDASLPATPRINAGRLLRRIAELGAVGGLDGGGCARLALTDADKAGRDLVVSWMHELELDVRTDAVGNVVGVRAGHEPGPAVMTGSHIDTVRTGGLYDGNLGVLAGLEVIETLATAGITTRRPLAVAFFTNEEGARFAPDMLGSLAYVGGLSVEEAYDTVAIDGARFGDELDRIGYLGSTPCPGESPFAFVELHIEQGPVLEAEGIRLGAVTGVQGISWQQLTITGQSCHAGTTPMRLRRDPGYVAMEIGVFVRKLADEFGPPQVGTVGKLDLYPNLVNVVPGKATMTVDLRNTNETTLRAAESQFSDFCNSIAAREEVTIDRKTLARFEPVVFDDRVLQLIEQGAAAYSEPIRRMPSGAGHDAQMFARVCPTAMIFVPSVGGISHNVVEFTEAADLELGANILLRVLTELAEQEKPWAAI